MLFLILLGAGILFPFYRADSQGKSHGKESELNLSFGHP